MQSPVFEIENSILLKYRGNNPYVKIPHGVTAIGDRAFCRCHTIESVTIPETVVSIGSGAFDHCSKLKTIVIPDQVTDFGDSIFLCCSNLVHVQLPSGIQKIPQEMFYQCHNLKDISIPATVLEIGHNAFYQCRSLSHLSLSEDCVIINNPFQECEMLADSDGFVIFNHTLYNYCGKLSELTIPYGVTAIAKYAFLEMRLQIVRITLPESVTEIRDYAFWRCRKLRHIHFPSQLRSIGVEAFSHCSALESVSIPDSIEKIGRNAFENCSCLAKLSLPVQIPELGESVFSECRKLADENGFVIVWNQLYNYYGSESRVIIPDGITGVRANAFSESKTLVEVVFPDSVTTIGHSCFDNCLLLESVRLPAGLCEIPHKMFQDCSCLKHIVIPKDVTFIGTAAFSGCGSLKSLDLPVGIREIGSEAFSRCPELTEFVFPNSVTTIGESALCRCLKLQRVTLPCSLEKLESYVFQGDHNLSEICIPETVTSIEASAFSGCSKLTHICLPEKLLTLGYGAFFQSGLTEITLPPLITTVPNGCFSSCVNLQRVSFPHGLVAIEDSAFSGCVKLDHVLLPPTVTQIGASAFHLCECLHTLEILGETVTMGSLAFHGCPLLQDENGFVIIHDKLFDAYLHTSDVVIPSGVRCIGSRSLNRNTNPIFTLSIPHTVVEIESDFLDGYETLFEIDITSVDLLNQILKEANDYSTTLCLRYLDSKKTSHCWQMICMQRRRELIPPLIYHGNSNHLAKLLDHPDEFLSLPELEEYLFYASENTEITAFFLDYQNRHYSAEDLENHRMDQEEKELGLRDRTMEDWQSIFELDFGYKYVSVIGYKRQESIISIPDTIGTYRVLISAPSSRLLQCRAQQVIIAPGILSVDTEAFANLPQLTDVYFQGADTFVSNNAFENCPNLTIHAPADSMVATYARENAIPFEAVPECESK